jgi:hypothetical protein
LDNSDFYQSFPHRVLGEISLHGTKQLVQTQKWPIPAISRYRLLRHPPGDNGVLLCQHFSESPPTQANGRENAKRLQFSKRI